MNQQQNNIVKPVTTRLLSLDALRGFDMFWIIKWRRDISWIGQCGIDKPFIVPAIQQIGKLHNR